MNTPIQTEAAEIYGGPLDGIRVSVVTGKDRFSVGKMTGIDQDLVCEECAGLIWIPGTMDVDLYLRTNRKTEAGRVVFVPSHKEEVAA